MAVETNIYLLNIKGKIRNLILDEIANLKKEIYTSIGSNQSPTAKLEAIEELEKLIGD